MNSAQCNIAGSVAFVGDIFIPDNVSRIVFSDELKHIMDSCRVRSCNFESPVNGVGQEELKVGPHLRQSVNAPSVVERAGFNLVNLANNHICDFGPDALSATKKSFHVATIGVGMSLKEAVEPVYFDLNGMNVGFLSFGEAEFGAIMEDGGGFAWVNHPCVNTLIREVRQTCDVLLVQVHAGVEKSDLPLPEWRQRYKELIDAGADAVIATHPHVPQGWEEYKGKPVFYSTGNFCFIRNDTHPYWQKGLLVKLDIHTDGSVSHECYGVERNGNAVSLSHDADFTRHLDVICRMLRSEEYNKEIDRIALDSWEHYYRRYYENAINGVSRFNVKNLLKFFKRLLFREGMNVPFLIHNNRIESHYWLARRAFNQLYQKQSQHGKNI